MIPNTSHSLYTILFGAILFLTACSDYKADAVKEAQQKVEQTLKADENLVKVLGRSSAGIDFNNQDFDALSSQVIRALAESAYEARKAYLGCELFWEKKKKAIDKNYDNLEHEKYFQDSVYHSLLKETVLQIDNPAPNPTTDPTIQELVIKTEQLILLRKELDVLCE